MNVLTTFDFSPAASTGLNYDKIQPMPDHLSPSIENYLKTIYQIISTGKRASTNEIAAHMGVMPASVTGMLQKMAASEPPLVEYRKHHGAVLTPDGEAVALAVVRQHRLLELFLHEVLGYTWDEVHVEADRLEHVISQDMVDRMARVLGNPQRDPHGDPIPRRDLSLPPHSSLRLGELRPGQAAVVERVGNEDAGLLRFLGELGVLPGRRLRVTDYSPYDQNLSIVLDGQETPIILGAAITGQIYVAVV
jgi:DtxR family Mn-dependent transcriptional regulator